MSFMRALQKAWRARAARKDRANLPTIPPRQLPDERSHY
jgi:hypothetical protein